MNILFVCGTRPNFIKVASLIRECKKLNIDFSLVHTGQHYNVDMSHIFFKDMNLPKPDINFCVGSDLHGKQTAKIITFFEELCIKRKPDVVVVVGDVNSTMACSLVTSKLRIPLAHVEAGLRSFDRDMPEEVNRVVTDVLSDYLFCTDYEAGEYLKKNVDIVGSVYVVGDVIIDTLLYYLQKIKYKKDVYSKPLLLITLHRPANVDNKEKLSNIVNAIQRLTKKFYVVFPVHPRTKKRLIDFDLLKKLDFPGLYDPVGYLDFLELLKNASVVLTDSGGVQLETSVINVPCVTVRDTTERLFTITEGTNTLVEPNCEKIVETVINSFYFKKETNFCRERKLLFDGNAASRILKILTNKKSIKDIEGM